MIMAAFDEPQTERELLLDIRKDVKDLLKCKNDHENRIRKLEGIQATILGVGAALSVLITTCGYWLLNRVFH